jgi:uncharacterized glyoxalase superfamily protein PhnB
MAVKPVPDGYHSVTPYLVVNDAGKLIEFMTQVFGAEETFRMGGDTIMHAEVRLGDSVIMLGDANEQHPPRPAMIHVYMPDADAAYRKALAAGAKSISEPADQFNGDRSAGIEDAFGNHWWIATHIEDVPPEEMERRAAAAAAAQGSAGG